MADNAGRAYIFFGGPGMDTGPDLNFSETGPGAYFGSDTICVGDLNGDGYDDIAIGHNDGPVLVYFGGAGMDNTADLTLFEGKSREGFGYHISGPGDLNGDGFSDIVVGAYKNGTIGKEAGAAFVYFGGRNMDTTSDLVLFAESAGEWFGCCVEIVGDLNGDGFDDLAVSAPKNDAAGTDAGKVYLFLGGSSMDASPDASFTGICPSQGLGFVLARGCDVNRDGYADMVAAAPYDPTNGYRSGSAFVYLGGPKIDTAPDYFLNDSRSNDEYGTAVCSGNLDGDGWPEVLVGAPLNHTFGAVVHVYERVVGLKGTSVTIGSGAPWSKELFFNGTIVLSGFEQGLNDYLQSHKANLTDNYFNNFVDVPLTISAMSDGNIPISNFSILYNYTATTVDFADKVNEYAATHRDRIDSRGYIAIPLTLRARTPGPVLLTNLSITVDEPPRLLHPILDLEMEEDTINSELLDLHTFFEDDFDSDDQLAFTILSATNDTIVRVEVAGNQYLSVDALEGPQNDNWTGKTAVVVACADRRGLQTVSNEFNVTIRNVNDEPVVTSEPPCSALAGVEYAYHVRAVDGDGDELSFSLARCPENMTIDPGTGLLRWFPRCKGRYGVSVGVSDGLVTAFQNYTISVPNQPPRIVGPAPEGAIAAIPLEYKVPAVDDDGDALTFLLTEGPPGMTLDATSGLLGWTPLSPGAFNVSIAVNDGGESVWLNFTLVVTQGNRSPTFTSGPVRSAVTGIEYIYHAGAVDSDGDALIFSLVSGPEGMTINSSTGEIHWLPATSGNFTVVIKVSDGRGGEATQEFVVAVSEAVRPVLRIDAPREGAVLSGKVELRGMVVAGTRGVVRVEIRLDGREWLNASGNLSWSHALDTRQLSNGRHTLEVRAFDGWEFSDVVSRGFEVSNREALSFESYLPVGLLVGLVIALILAGVVLLRKRRAGPEH